MVLQNFRLVSAKRNNSHDPQLRTAIERLGLSQEGLGRFLGVQGRSVRRWISGEWPVPKPVALLLRLMVRLDIMPDDVS